jgi:hypothetical protein
MAEPIPLLQIVHVSDLHVCENYSDKAHLAAEGRAKRLWIRKQLERHNILGWHEGTLPHDDRALAAFERFLKEWSGGDRVWFPVDRSTGPETWLVDTGDATTFGDPASLAAAHSLLDTWRQILAPCQALSLFGNHDAWPGTQPALLAGAGYAKRIEAQRALFQQWPAWDARRWMQQPLVTSPPTGLPRIELYGLNSVSFGLLDNTRAVGRIVPEDVDAMCHEIEGRATGPVYRALATHHPIAFPYEPDEVSELPLAKTMLLANHRRLAGRLKNDPPRPGTRSRPFIHLVLSGHTHLGLPATMPSTVKESRQGEFGRDQLQLVAGSLMLVRNDEAVKAGWTPQVMSKLRDDFTHPTDRLRCHPAVPDPAVQLRRRCPRRPAVGAPGHGSHRQRPRRLRPAR